MRWNRPPGLILAALTLSAWGADEPPRSPNLLGDGSFEAGSAGWSAGSWRVPIAEASIVEGEAREGRRSATLRIEGPADDARIFRLVRVVPGRRYRVGGWVKTSKVAPGDPDATVGASLCLMDRPERSESLFGDQDWTELGFEFTPDVEEVRFAARLGFYSSTVTGQAWFDDLRLVDIGPGPAVASSPARPATVPPPVDDPGRIQGRIEFGPQPAPAPPSFDGLWVYAGFAFGLPLVLALSWVAVARRLRMGMRAAGAWLAGASLALLIVGFLGSSMVGWGAVPLFLIAVALMLIPPARPSRAVDRTDLAPGEVGFQIKVERPGLMHLAALAFGLLLMVASTPFLSAAILSLLAMPVLLVGSVAVGLSLALLPRSSDDPIPWPSSLGGGFLIVVGSFALMVILFAMSSMLGGRTPASGNDALMVAAGSAAGWLAFVGLLRVGIGLRGADDRLSRDAFVMMLVTLPLALALGSYLWPFMPKSL